MNKILITIVLLSGLMPAKTPENDASISGVITDADTGERLPYVNVFIANTTIGDASDSAGVFLLERVPKGTYQLVFSHIGHELQVMTIHLSNNDMVLNIKLAVKPIEGEQIEVAAEAPDVWRKMLDEFTRYFIGTSSRAQKTFILNPEVLDLKRHPETKCLIAETDSTLRVRNELLGYNIRVVLKHFHWRGDSGNYVIYPQFSDIEFQNSKHQKRCYKEREKVYERSLRRFLSCVALFDIPRSYTVSLYTTKPQPAYIPLEKKDFMILLSSPFTPGARRRLATDRSIRVDYKMANSPSYLNLNYGYIDISDNGIYAPMDGVTLSGQWGTWRLADTLPFNYQPE